MSIDLISRALRADLKPAPKIVLIAICDQISDQPGKDVFWGSQQWLGGKINMSERQVRQHLKYLEDEGWITRSKRTKSSGAYDTDHIGLVDGCFDQRRKPADGDTSGGKASDPAAENGPDQRRKPAAKNLTENLNENSVPGIEDFWAAWTGLGLQGEGDSIIQCSDAWSLLDDESKRMACLAAPLFQKDFRKRAAPDISMLGSRRFLGERRFDRFRSVLKPKEPIKPKPMDLSDDNWAEVQGRFIARFGQAVFNAWISGVEFRAHLGDIVTLSVDSKMKLDWITTNYLDWITETYERMLSKRIKVALIGPVENVSRETKVA